ncbi:MAG: hypothetical protein ACC642_01920 [Pseudomonadales bacterium]
MKTTVRLLPGLLLMISAGAFAASELMVYANQGQDAAQQEQDEYQCYWWGKGQSGFDPMAQPTATAPPPEQQAKRGGLLRGAARGAVVGGIVDGSSGAKTGAAAGAALGGMRRIDQNRQQAKSQQQYEQQQAAQYEAGRSAYNRAYAACLEGRGYTVR